MGIYGDVKQLDPKLTKQNSIQHKINLTNYLTGWVGYDKSYNMPNHFTGRDDKPYKKRVCTPF